MLPTVSTTSSVFIHQSNFESGLAEEREGTLFRLINLKFPLSARPLLHKLMTRASGKSSPLEFEWPNRS